MTGASIRDGLTRLVRWLIGARLTVYCLAILMFLTFFGTLYQVDHGLYAAQERYYSSWIILFFGFIPFPGTQLVLTVLTVNLALYLYFLVMRKRIPFGILLTHLGILMMLLGGAITRWFGQESQLTLFEGETSSASASYYEWELAAWKQDGMVRDVVAFDADDFAPGRTVRYDDAGLTVEVLQYHRNARAFASTAPRTNAPLNAQGITSIQSARLEQEPERNVAAGVFRVTPDGGDPVDLILFGEEVSAKSFPRDGQEYFIHLRRIRRPLPFVVTLKDFHREMHPGTQIAKSFSSDVLIAEDGVDRPVNISMNKPFRDRGYTLFQASYIELPDGRQASTFAVTKNAGRLIPYVSTGVVVFGMIWHFIAMLIRRVRAASTGAAS